MKKKVIAGVMSMIMVLAMVVPAFAEEDTRNTRVTYEAPSTYEVSIPSMVNLNEERSMEITATAMNIPPQRFLTVRVSKGIENGGVSLKRGWTNETITAKVSLARDGEGIKNGDVVAIFIERGNYSRATHPQGGGKLYFEELEAGLPAGNWAGQLVFELAITDNSN